MNKFFGSDFLKLMLEDLGTEGKPIIRSVRTLDELQQVYRLTHECYSENGFFKTHPSGMLVHYPMHDHIPETTVLVAIMEGKIVGSVSLTVDGPSGFTIDEDFKETCDAIRAEGNPVCVVWRLVVDKNARSGRAVVSNLINHVIELALKKGQDVALFSVNPRHENVYQRMLNMKVTARKATTEGLENAPAVLLRGDAKNVLAVLAEKSTKNETSGSPAPLFQLIANSPY